MPMQPVQFAAQSYRAESGVVSEQRLVNLYLEANPEGAKGPVALYGTPGLKPWQTVGSGPIRGMRPMGAYLYVVSGAELYGVESDGTQTLVGDIGGSGNVHITDNGTHLGIATSTDTYAASVAAGVLALPESGMVGATYQDGYGIFAQGGTENFWVTGLDDMTTIGALDFSTADAFADYLVGCISDHRELWLFGQSTTEVWFNSGDAVFPFARAQGGFMERGCCASGSIAKADNTVYWLGDDKAVYAASGYQPQPISNPAIERLIDNVTDPTSAWAFFYHQRGHTFYVLTFSDLTLCYDTKTGLWHERRSEGIDRWRANAYAEAFSRHLVGDYANGQVYELDLDTYDDDGDTISREAVAPPLHANGDFVAMHEFFLDCETGVGLNAGQGSIPLAMLDWSDDGGKTWSNKREAGLGAIGAYGTRLMWNRLGTFRQRSLRLTITDPVKVAIVGAYARLEVRA